MILYETRRCAKHSGSNKNVSFLFENSINAIYDVINREAFSNELPKISFKLVNLDGFNLDGYNPDGLFYVRNETYRRILTNGRHSTYQIEYLSICISSKKIYFRDSNEFLQIIDLIFHEMIHEYCYLQGIDDCDSKTQYHNFAFLQAAEMHGLHCIKHSTEYGFSEVITSDELFTLILSGISEEMWEFASASIKCVAA